MQLLVQLNEYEVRYIVAWGVGEEPPEGAPGDLGIWMAATPDNVSKLRSLLVNMGYDPEDVAALRGIDCFHQRPLSLHLPSGLIADFLTALPDFECEEFDARYAGAPVVRMDDISFRILENERLHPAGDMNTDWWQDPAVVVTKRYKI